MHPQSLAAFWDELEKLGGPPPVLPHMFSRVKSVVEHVKPKSPAPGELTKIWGPAAPVGSVGSAHPELAKRFGFAHLPPPVRK